MATKTSKVVTGNLSTATNWVGDVAPLLDGTDNIIIASGATITLDVNATFTAAGAADAVQVNGTNSTTYGELIVPDGITLTLVGVDTANQQAMQIQRYAKFTPQPGATIVVNSPGDYSTQIDNQGRLYAMGTVSKPITFTSPAANYSWNTSVTDEAVVSGLKKYNSYNARRCLSLLWPWISNAAGTGLGSRGDTSINITVRSPNSAPNGPICTNEVASESLVLAVGDYYVDYNRGLIIFYQPSGSTNSSITVSYKRLSSTKVWGISSVQNNTYNEAKFDYCSFNYMGKTGLGTSQATIAAKWKNSAASSADRLFQLTNCTFNYCWNPLQISDLTGTAGDPILITDNVMNYPAVNQSAAAIYIYRGTLTYVTMARNTIYAKGTPFGTAVTSATTHTGVDIDSNNCTTANSAGVSSSGGGSIRNDSPTVATKWSNTTVRRNKFFGFGSGSSSSCRAITDIQGVSDVDKVVFDNNDIGFQYHGIACGSYLIFRNNTVQHCYHHGLTPGTQDHTIARGVEIYNNLFYGEATLAQLGYDSCPQIQLGFPYGGWVDDWKIYNNTFVGSPYGCIGFGQFQDPNLCDTLGTRLYFANNIAVMVDGTGATAFQRKADTTTVLNKFHILQCDYNLNYNQATRYNASMGNQGTYTKGGVNYSSMTGASRNITGVSLHMPSVNTTIAESPGKTLDFTYTSTTNMTLGFNGETATQLVFGGSGTSYTVASIGTAGTFYEIVNVTGTPFSTTRNASNCPVSRWLVWLTGAAAGDVYFVSLPASTSQIRVAPRWTAGRVPLAGDTFVIIESEVSLALSGGTVKAGIYFPELPTSTKQDTGIGFADHSITGSNPLLVNGAATYDTYGVNTPKYYKTSFSSPAKRAGTTGSPATTDYFGLTRPTNPSIGFYEVAAELVATIAATSGLSGLLDYLSQYASTVYPAQLGVRKAQREPYDFIVDGVGARHRATIMGSGSGHNSLRAGRRSLVSGSIVINDESAGVTNAQAGDTVVPNPIDLTNKREIANRPIPSDKSFKEDNARGYNTDGWDYGSGAARANTSVNAEFGTDNPSATFINGRRTTNKNL